MTTPSPYRSPRWLAALLLPLLATAGLHASEAEPTVREGRVFRVTCHFRDGPLADAALATVEAVWKPAAALYGLRTPPEALLDVHLYRTPADYVAAEAALTQGRFARNLAFAHYDTCSAHVAVQPPVSDAALERMGLPWPTRALLAHEASHLVRFDACPAFRAHPDWLADGAALLVRNRALKRVGALPLLEEQPMTSKALLRVVQLLENGRLPGIGAILRDETSDLAFYERYALRGALFAFLLEVAPRKTAFARALHGLRRRGERDDFAELYRKDVEKAVAPRGIVHLDTPFRAWIATLTPAWDEVFRSLDTSHAPWVQAAFADTNAIAWRTDAPATPPYAVAGRLQILPGEGRQLNVLLDRSDAGFVSVALVGSGHVTVFEYASKSDVWARRGSQACAALADGAEHAFEVRVESDTVAVRIDGQLVVHTEALGRTWRGAYGLGAQAGTAGLWRDVALEPPTPQDTRR